ncbi:MAG: 2-phospho-L-lactate transferase CofD family protein, partial [Candidatus Limnocylindria bacterium]|nr:2-phospho-L-lactate transferase CofD family protein [Candidatus Limnocylindria bacterium]
LPVTLYNTHLCAELVDGTTVEEEVQVRGVGKAAIRRIFLKDDNVTATPGSVEAIESADLITLGPGSLYTTVAACLLVPEIARAIANANGVVAYVANTTRQPGQTDGMTLSDHVRVVQDYLGGSGLDVALLNDDLPPAHLRTHYAERGLEYMEPTALELEKIRGLGVRAVTAPVIDKWSGPRDLWLKQDTIRHDAERIARALVALVDERRHPALRAL